MGIRLLPGGKGVFPQMTVRENLEMAAFVYRSDKEDLERRIAKVLELFPKLAERQGQAAGSLSGGQQQMLALAAVLLHEPEVLIIDELSLGLAPIMVQELLQVVERLKEGGMTIIIVEQSLNVALAIADRAVFLEKGQVRFEGAAQDLLERDDLARAVFLGTRGRLRVIATLFTRQLVFDGVVTGWSTACWPWASCSSTGPPGSSTSPSATSASSAPGSSPSSSPSTASRSGSPPSSGSSSGAPTARSSSSSSSGGCSPRPG